MLRVAADIVRFRRKDSFVLMNGRYPRPLVFRRGRESVERALANPDSIEDSELRDLLCRFRILVEDDEPTPETHQHFSQDSKDELALYLLLTQRCNLGCVYCLGRNPSYLGTGKMTTEMARTAIRKAAESLRVGAELQLIYFGGEPLLSWELVKECIRYVEEELKSRFDLTFRHHVTTNLTVLPKDFIETAQRHGITVLVDVDGMPSVHDRMRPFRSGRPSYPTIAANLRKLQQADIYYEMRATVTSDNVELIRDIMKHHHEFRPEACAFPTLTPVDSEGSPLDAEMYPDPETYQQNMVDAASDGLFDLESLCPTNVIATRLLRGEFVTYGCGMLLGNTGVVDYSGDVYPCIYFVGQDEFRFGNVLEEGNPLAQEAYQPFFERYKDRTHVDRIPGCGECAVRYFCGGGCPVRLLSLTKPDEDSARARDYFRRISCATTWAGIESTVQHYEELATRERPSAQRSVVPGSLGKC